MADIDRNRDKNSTERHMKTILPLAVGILFLAGVTCIPCQASAPPAAEEAPSAEAASTVEEAPAAEPAATTEGTASAESTTDTTTTAAAETRGPVELVPGEAAVVGQNVNVRAQATIHSEVVTQLNEGDTVTVLDYIIRPNARKGDPALWGKIAYPTGAAPWVHSSYINPADKTVKASTLNVRAGPGENYSVIGKLKRGDSVVEVLTKDNWTQIEAPSGAFAFMAAKYLHQEIEEPPTVATVEEPEKPAEPEVEPTPVAEETAIAEAPTGEVAAVTPTEETVDQGEGSTTVRLEEPGVLPPIVPEPPEEMVSDEPPPPRVVQREGIVRTMTSIQAPSSYKLVSLDTGRNINYLHTTSTNLNLQRYVDLHIVVEGEESLDKRWLNTPVLTIKKIYVIE